MPRPFSAPISGGVAPPAPTMIFPNAVLVKCAGARVRLRSHPPGTFPARTAHAAAHAAHGRAAHAAHTRAAAAAHWRASATRSRRGRTARLLLRPDVERQVGRGLDRSLADEL